jgi:maleate isomerase/arylmalonate decarboxylase
MPSNRRYPDRAYGWTAKLGLIVPPTNSINEAEWQINLPEGVTLHVTRMPLHLDSDTLEGRRRLEADLVRAADDLAACDVDVVAYGCTAGSLVLPTNSLTDFLTAASARPAVATAPAIAMSLSVLGVKRIALATPYHNALTDHEAAFFQACGFDVVSAKGLGFGAGGSHEFRHIAKLDAKAVIDLVTMVDGPSVDAIVLSCTDLPTRLRHDSLEKQVGKPVISSNQATFYAALKSVDVPVSFVRWGRLFS